MKTDNDMPPRAFASIRFMGDHFDLDSVSRLMALHPTKSYRLGETFTAGRQQREMVRKTTLWLFDTDRTVSSTDLRDHVTFIQNLLTRDAAEFWRDNRYNEVNHWVRDHKANLDVALFWRGPTAAVPAVSATFDEIIKSIGGKIETDFARRDDDQGCQTHVYA